MFNFTMYIKNKSFQLEAESLKKAIYIFSEKMQEIGVKLSDLEIENGDLLLVYDRKFVWDVENYLELHYQPE